MKIDFDSLGSDERHIILVASDAKYAELKKEIDWKKVLFFLISPITVAEVALCMKLVESMFGEKAAKSTYLSTTWTGMAARSQAKDSPLAALFTKGEIPIPHLALPEARERFKFDVAHPQDGTVYLLNPCRDDQYLLAAQANERLAQEKLAAFMQLASALGAKRLELKSGEVEETSAKGKVEGPLPNAAGQLGLSASFEKDGSVQRQVIMEFGKPKKAPTVPEKLVPWLSMDPTLQSMADTRLDGEALKAMVNLAFDDTIDVGADVTAKIAGRGLKVGGTYRSVARSRWCFEVEFWPKPD